MNDTSRARWDALTDAALAPIQQRWAYGAAAAALGGGVLRFELRDRGTPVALAQAIRRRFGLAVTLISRGPVWIGNPDAERRAEALRLLRERARGVILITGRDETDCPGLAAAGLRDVMTPGTLAELALGDDLRARCHGKWRNRLAVAERSGLTVRRATADADFRWLYDLDHRQQRLRRYRALPPAFAEHWRAADRKSVLLLEAWCGEARAAAMLFLRHGTTATYHVGWTGPEGRARSAHNLILWDAARRLSGQGVATLDLGLIDTETAPGLARFKLGSGAFPVRTGGTWLGW